jgi:hypothetical protein
MTRYEYKVRPAPTKGRKAAGIKGPEARFAHGLELVMNEMGAEGWEYVRSDILPSEERQGLTSSHTVYRSVLVFRRALDAQMSDVVAPPPPADVQEAVAEAEPELPQEVIDAVENPEAELPLGEDEPDSTTDRDDDPDDTSAHQRPV